MQGLGGNKSAIYACMWSLCVSLARSLSSLFPPLSYSSSADCQRRQCHFETFSSKKLQFFKDKNFKFEQETPCYQWDTYVRYHPQLSVTQNRVFTGQLYSTSNQIQIGNYFIEIILQKLY